MPVLDPILINAVFVGVVLLLGAVVAAIVSNRASKTLERKTDLEIKTLARKTDLETLEGSYTKLQATYLTENDRLNVKVDRLQNEKDAALIQQSKDKIECTRQIAEQQIQISALGAQVLELTRKLPEPGAVSKVVIVGADIPKSPDGKVVNPLPVVIEGPLPVPMTAVERAALAAEAAAKVDKE